MWYDAATGTQYWYSDRDIIYMNPDSSNMFGNCKNLKSIDVSMFNTSKVTNMNYMFGYCSDLKHLDVSKFDTHNVTNFDRMFAWCQFLRAPLDVSNFNTSKVTNMSGMFYGCTSLSSIDISNFDTGKVTNMRYMFNSRITITYGPKFINTSLEYLNSLDEKNGSYNAFAYSQTLPPWTGGSFNSMKTFISSTQTTLVTGQDIHDIISQNINATIFVRSKDKPISSIAVYDISYAKDRSIITWYDEVDTTQYWYSDRDTIYMNPNCYSVFGRLNYTTIDISGFDTSRVTDMTYMFYGDKHLTNIIYGNKFVNTNATNFNDMFWMCSANKPNWTNGTWDSEGTFIKNP